MREHPSTTYVYGIELFTTQWLGANATGETVYMVDLIHSRATIALANDLLLALMTDPKVIVFLRHCA